MAEEQKQSSDPNDVWLTLEEAFSPKNKHWEQLYGDHSEAHGAARKAIKEKTTGLKSEEVISELGKYIKTYDEVIRGKPQGGKEYREIMAGGQARTVIEQYAQKNGMDLDDAIRKFQREGLEEILQAYSSSAKARDIDGFRSALIDKHVNVLNYELTKQMVAKLKEKQPLLKSKDDFLMQGNLKQYLLGHFMQYHEAQPVEDKKAT